MNRLRWVGILAALVLACICVPASAANMLEKLMMPGELSQAHAKLEENCSNCHETMNEKAQSGLCMDCHKPIKQDFAGNRGYHGKDPVVRKSECVSCHVEHKGRERNIVPLQPLMFQHELTELELVGNTRPQIARAVTSRAASSARRSTPASTATRKVTCTKRRWVRIVPVAIHGGLDGEDRGVRSHQNEISAEGQACGTALRLLSRGRGVQEPAFRL